MPRSSSASQGRRVAVETTRASAEGWLTTPAAVRTLDDLNRSGRFLMLYDATVTTPEGSHEVERLALSRDAVLYLRELSAPATSGRRVDPGRYTRVPVLLDLGACRLRGSLHAALGGDAMVRLSQDQHAFVALTGVTIDGPRGPSEAPFVAVGLGHVLMATPAPAAAPGEPAACGASSSSSSLV